MRRWWARIRGFLRRDAAATELRAEFESHLEFAIEEHVRRGLSLADARRRALLEAGSLEQAAEAVGDQRGLPWLDGLIADVRYAVRGLRGSFVFSVLVIVTLALGLGANTAIFSVVRATVLKPLPHRDGDRLVRLRQAADGQAANEVHFSVPEVRELRAGVPSLAGIAEYSSWSMIHQADDGAVRIDVGLVTGNYFEVMGLSPVLGRVTGPADDGPGVPPVIVLTYAAWQHRFAGDSAIIGRQLRLDGKSVTVIGVLEPAPFYPEPIEGLLNMVASEHHLSATMVEGRTHRMTEVVARMRADASLADVRTETAAVYARMQRDYSEAYDPAANLRLAVLPFKEVFGERARLTLRLLMGAAAFVLIISVASVANLTLMRGVRREHELVVRAALGAGAARLRRLLAVENLILACAGAAGGLVLARAALSILIRFLERYSTRASEIRLDAAALGFMAALVLVVAFLLSWILTLPRERSFAARMLAGGHRLRGSIGKQRAQRALVVVQVAVSVVLLAGAGLLTRTMVRLAEVNTGLRTEEVLSMQVPLLTPTQLLTDPASDGAAKERYEQMRRELGALPGVIEVGLGSIGPLRSSTVGFDVRAEGHNPPAGAPVPYAEFRTADPTYFRAAGIPLLRGRHFTTADRYGSENVVIINEVLAHDLFPGENPVGKRVAWTGDVLRFTPISGDWRTVVGVVARTQDGGLDAQPVAAMYLPFHQVLALGGSLVVRADTNAAALIPAATRIVKRIAPTAPIERVQTIAQVKDQSVAPRRLNAALISLFGALALVIAAVGIGGVLAFSVSARTNEIGIRMSLGANRARVQRMVLREGGVLVLLGMAIGIGTAIGAGSVVQGLLFGITPYDPITLAAVAAGMSVVGGLACWLPANRAARVDPVITMRAE